MTETDSVLDFDKICRTCLLEADDMKPLYEECVSDVCLVEMLMSCTFVEFAINDGLPSQICRKCLGEITRAYKFAETCDRVDKILRKCLKLIGKQYDDMRYNRKRHTPLTIITEDETSKHCESITDKSNIQRPGYINKAVVSEETVIDEPELQENSVIVKYETILTDDIEKTDVNSESEPSDIRNLPRSDGSCEFDSASVSVGKVRCNKLKSGPPFQCKKCYASFPLYHMLREHFRKAQHAKKEYANRVCPVCSKSVSYSHYNHHLRTHTSEKPYCCEFCGKRFVISNDRTTDTSGKNSDGSTRPARAQTEPVKCEICNQFYKTPGALKTHLVTHGDKKFVCSDCGRGFISNLTVHLRTHTGETPYICPVCQKGFYDSSSMKKHCRGHGQPSEQSI
ncbi:Meiotic central spindle [Carabus blaptoides fortunei]